MGKLNILFIAKKKHYFLLFFCRLLTRRRSNNRASVISAQTGLSQIPMCLLAMQQSSKNHINISNLPSWINLQLQTGLSQMSSCNALGFQKFLLQVLRSIKLKFNFHFHCIRVPKGSMPSTKFRFMYLFQDCLQGYGICLMMITVNDPRTDKPKPVFMTDPRMYW